MPLPTVRDVHTNRPLTNIAVAFMQDPSKSLFMQVFPPVPVTKKSDSYYIWDRGDMNRDEARETAPGDEYPIGRKRLSDDSYNCRVYKYAEMVADEERENQDDPLDLDQTATETVMAKHVIRQNRQWASAYFTAGVWTGGIGGGDFAVANAWSDEVNGTPIVDVRTNVRFMTRKGVDRRNMKLVLPPEDFDNLIKHPTILERYENVVTTEELDEAMLARIFGIGRVIVGEAVYNAAAEGDATDDQFVLGSGNALLVWTPPRPAINVPSAGYTFLWTGLTGSTGRGVQVSKIRRDERDADQIKGRSAFDTKRVSTELGCFFTGI